MKRLLLLLPLLSLLPLAKGVITNNVPISQMVITTNVEDNAYFPLIQPYPGRTTNDNFRATTASIFNGRGSGSFTNLTINNLTVVSNLFLTNVTVQEFSTTNIFNDTVTYITNSFLVISNTTVTINGTNVATINPTVGRVPYNVDGVNFGDSALFYIDPDTVGAAEVDAGLVAITNLANNTYLVTRTIGGIDGVITNGPAIGSFELWTNSAGYLQPFDLTQPLFWTNSVTWGPGTTNVLARIDNTLLYAASDQSGPIYPYIGVTNLTEANMALFGSGGNLAVIRGSGGVSLSDSISAGNELRWFGHYWAPPSDTHAQLGGDMNSTEQPWYQVNARTNTVYGFRSDTNYSRGAIYHTGTNGAVVFDSQANGSAGSPVPIDFDFNGSPRVVVSDRSGAPDLQLIPGSGNLARINGTNLSFLYFTFPSSKDWRLSASAFGPEQDSVQLGFPTHPFSVLYNNQIIWNDYATAGFAHPLEDAFGLSTPEGNTSAMVGSIFRNTNGIPGAAVWIKTSGSDGNTGWSVNGIANHTPASSSETNYLGAMTWDASYFYLWTATNVNKRIAFSTW